MTDIADWLASLGLEKHATAFASQDITPDLLTELSDADLRELGVSSMGERKRLQKAIAALSAASAPATAGATPLGPAQPPVSAPAAPATNPATVTGTPARPDEGERRHATVMFSDLTGYTALNEAFDPEEVESIMSRIKREASAVIERHGGRVNQFVGDEVMAMFGVPISRRDDPRRAVAAALELHRTVDGIAAGLTERLGRTLSMHTGIQSGLVIARRSDSRSGDFQLTGDTVNTAARLRGLARPGEVVVSPQTWQQVSDFYEAQAGTPVEVKGKEQALVPWRILAERAVPRSGNRPLVGRDEEMQQFEMLAEACLQRQRGRVVFVRGDPGMGKSRLVAEFLDTARERGLTCHATTILDFGARTGARAIRRLLQSLLGLAPDADEASRAEAIDELAASDPAGSEHASYLYELLSVAAPASVRSLLAATEPGVRQRASLEALCHVVRREGAQLPMLLLVEDIHWADAWTLKQLAALGALCAQQPLLLMMTTRFAGDPSLGEWRAALHGLPVTSIDLGPLADDDAMRLAAGAASISEALLKSCVERAEGNPLFLEQLLLNAGDEGAGSLPGSIQALIQARMDRLGQLDKNALQAAAVWGPRVPLEAIRHLLGEAAYDPQPLVDQFLLRPEGDELVFSHALFRDGAYGSLLHARRRQLHQLAAEWVEPRDVALAAQHFERAEDPRAADAWLRAALALETQYQQEDALVLVERALRLTVGEPPFAARLARARLLLGTGRAAEAIGAAAAALEAAGTGGERALGMIEMAAAMRIVDRSADGLDMLRQAQPLAEAAGLTLALSRLHHLRGNLLFASNRTLECQHEHELALALARQAGSAESEAAALGGVGDAHFAQGRVRTSFDLFSRCVALTREQGFLQVEVPYLTMMGWCSYYLMDLRGAMRANLRALELATRIGHRRGELLARMQNGMLHGWVGGHWRDGLAQVEQALVMARAMGSRRFEANAEYIRALMVLRSGDRDNARRHLHHALELCGDAGLHFVGSQVYGGLGRVATDSAERRAMLARGEALLSEGAMSQNFFGFCDGAIDSSLEHHGWDEALHYAQLLERFTAAEPFPWSEFAVARARLLVRLGRGERGPELARALERLRQQVVRAEASLYLPSLERAAALLEASAKST